MATPRSEIATGQTMLHGIEPNTPRFWSSIIMPAIISPTPRMFLRICLFDGLSSGADSATPSRKSRGGSVMDSVSLCPLYGVNIAITTYASAAIPAVAMVSNIHPTRTRTGSTSK